MSADVMRFDERMKQDTGVAEKVEQLKIGLQVAVFRALSVPPDPLTVGQQKKEDYLEVVNLEKIKRRVKWLGIIGGVFFLAVVAFYVCHFRDGLDIKTGTWGEFGDYLGGVLNPIFSFLAFLGLLWTILVSYEQLKGSQSETQKSDVFRMIDIVYREIENLLYMDLTIFVANRSPNSNVKASIFGTINSNEMDRLNLICSQHTLVVSKFVELLLLLRVYCKYYQDLGGEKKITDYYRVHYFRFVEVMKDYQNIDGETLSFYKEKRDLQFFPPEQ